MMFTTQVWVSALRVSGRVHAAVVLPGAPPLLEQRLPRTLARFASAARSRPLRHATPHVYAPLPD